MKRKFVLSLGRSDTARHGLLWGALTALGLLLGATVALATSKDGIFPTADQVGGQVFTEPLKPGTEFPTDFPVYDSSGKPVDLGKMIHGKKTVLAFFISAAPVSVAEVRKLQDFIKKNAPHVQQLNLNADTVGVALEGGPAKAIAATARTLKVIEHEQGIKNLYIAPNDALDPKGLSNRLGFRGLPTVFVLNANGTVQKVFVGPHNWTKQDLG